MTYLTSPGALNPLPARPPVSISEHDQNDQPRGFDPGTYDRPRKTLSEDAPSSRFQPEIKQEPAEPSSSLLNGIKEELDTSRTEPDRPGPQSYTLVSEASTRPPPSPTPKTLDLPDSEPNGTTRPKEGKRKTWAQLAARHDQRKGEEPTTEQHSETEAPQDGEAGKSQLLTAIYRPESKAAWREELRAANEKAEKVRQSSVA